MLLVVKWVARCFASSSMRRATKPRAASTSVVRSIGTVLARSENNTASGQVLVYRIMPKFILAQGTLPICGLIIHMPSPPASNV